MNDVKNMYASTRIRRYLIPIKDYFEKLFEPCSS